MNPVTESTAVRAITDASTFDDVLATPPPT
jgi:hypothetical protein